MIKQKEKLIFTLLLFSIIILSITSVNAINTDNNTSNPQITEQHKTINNLLNENNQCRQLD